MKSLRPILLVLPCLAWLPLGAQTNIPSGPPHGGGGERQGPMAMLSDAERAQVKAAHDAAIQKDPSLEQAMKDARLAMEKARKSIHDAMVAVDPSVEPILAKMTPPKWEGQKGPRPGPQGQKTEEASKAQQHPRHDNAPKGMAGLTESERQQIKALHEQVRNDPAVVAAREAVKSASTPAARRSAEETQRKVAHEAMIKADPSVAPILERLHSEGGGGGGAQQSNGETMMQSQ